MDERRIRVLLVEDDEDDYLLTRELLSEIKSEHFDLDWSTNVAAARAALARQPYDICLIDYRLGAESGLDLLRHLVADGCRVPVIVLTGLADRDIDLEVMRAGADYLSKERIDAALLERAIRYAIERHRHQEELRHLHAGLERQVQERTEELRKANEILQAEAVERKRAEEALREADRRKDEFLAMLAHELRNPLAPVRNAVQILRLSGISPETAEQARAVIDRQVQHLVRLVDDLLDVSRIMRGKIELRKQRLDLAGVVARAVETAQPIIDAHGQRLEVALPAEPLWVEGDLVRLTQVLANLLNNAAKFTERAGRIFLTATREADAVEVRVGDTGIGIAPELLPKVFDLFVQADRSIARSQGGLGIGLTVVKHLVELHGGTVSVTSAGTGQGSEFIVRMPTFAAAPAGGPPLAPGEEKPKVAHSRRVLVVDDNVDAANSLAMLLRLNKHQVCEAHDGFAALQAADQFLPDVVLLDIGLPGLSGYDVAKRLRADPRFAEILVVAMTGYGQEEDRQRSRQAGFDHHLVKPVEPGVVQKLLLMPG